MINSKFEKKMRHTNYIFSNSIDLIHEFFNLERKSNSKILSKTIKLIGKNPKLNKITNFIALSPKFFNELKIAKNKKLLKNIIPATYI